MRPLRYGEPLKMPASSSVARGFSRAAASGASAASARARSLSAATAPSVRASSRAAGVSPMRSMNGRRSAACCAAIVAASPRRVLGALRPQRFGSVSTTRRPGRLSSRRTAPPCSRATACTRLRPRPVPGCGAALLQTHEALQHALAILRRDARAVVGDGDLDRLGRRSRRSMVISAPLRTSPGLAEYLMALSMRLATACTDELTIAGELRAVGDVR